MLLLTYQGQLNNHMKENEPRDRRILQKRHGALFNEQTRGNMTVGKTLKPPLDVLIFMPRA